MTTLKRRLLDRTWAWWHMRHRYATFVGPVWTCSCGSLRQGPDYTQGEAALTAAMIKQAEVTVEWNVMIDGLLWLQPWTTDESVARDYLRDFAPCVDRYVVNRVRATTPDIVEDWRPA